MDRWFTDVAAHTLRPKTLESYEGMIRLHIKPDIGHVKLTSLRADHLQALYSKKLADGYSRRTVHYIHAIISRALSQAERWGLVPRNVARLAQPPSIQTPPPTFLTSEQVKQFLDAVKDKRFYPLYVLAISTGMRKGELLGLYWEDVDFFTRTVHVRHAAQELVGKGVIIVEPKSEKSKRSIPAPGITMDVLWEYREKTGHTSGLVFRTKNGNPFRPRNFDREFKENLQLSGLPDMRFHDLRHTAASLMLTAGVHPKVVQEMLGHSQINLTLDTYSHILPVIQREAADKMDAILR